MTGIEKEFECDACGKLLSIDEIHIANDEEYLCFSCWEKYGL
jgi:formylmethanofuran dehydrogenase subunit E